MTTPLSPRAGARPAGLAATPHAAPSNDAGAPARVQGKPLYLKPGLSWDRIAVDYASVRVAHKRASAMQAFLARLKDLSTDAGPPAA